MLQDIPSLRLNNQLISTTTSTSISDVVRWMGALQAQDYPGGLWAIGLRVKNVTSADVELAIKNKEIVRSWPMRGTLHFVPAEDLRWMLKLMATRTLKKTSARFRELELTEEVLNKSRDIIEKVLADGNALTRPELYAILEKNGIKADEQRGFHILGFLAVNSVICYGPKKEKQPTFVLLDEWLPKTKDLETDEAISKITLTYFQSHGPATIHDFSWWSGLNLTEIRLGIEILGKKILHQEKNGKIYYMSDVTKNIVQDKNVYLLPPYDEYTVSYKHRDDVLDPKHVITSRNGIFSPIIVVYGKIVGIWSRKTVKNTVKVTPEFFIKIGKSEQKLLDEKIAEVIEFYSVKNNVI